MDPYLEAPAHWPTFHHQMIVGLAEALQPSLGDRYRLRFGTRTYTVEQVLFTSILKEEHKESFIELRHRSTDKLLTLVEVVSPANRTTTAGRKAYASRRDDARQQGAHLVEVDLVLDGPTCLEADLSSVADRQYVVAVLRVGRPSRQELAGTTLQKRLPRVRVPLAGDDRDVMLDLQAVFTRCYDRFFAGRIDYKKDPPVRLADDDHEWAVQVLKDQGLR
jgi:hypothetical protein